MKTCPNCNCQNPSDAWLCQCGHEFAAIDTPDSIRESEGKQLSPTSISCVLLGCVFILSLGALMGVILQDDLFAHYLFTLAGLAILIPVFFLLAVICIVLRILKRGIGRRLEFSFTIAGALILSLLIFLVVNGRLDAWKNDAVCKYVARAVPMLDDVKHRTGSYPPTLPVSTLGEPPSLLKNYGGYRSDGDTFTFEYIDEPAGWAGGEGLLEFNSSERIWRNVR